MPAVTRPVLSWQVDWTDSGTYGQTPGYPPSDLSAYIRSAYVESGGGGHRRSTSETARVSGRVAGRLRCSNRSGVFSAKGVTTYDTALTRPHIGRLHTGASSRGTVQIFRVELVHSDEEVAEFEISSRYPLLDTRLGEDQTTPGNVTPAAYAGAVLTLAHSLDSNQTKPAVRATVPAALRVGAAGSTLDVPERPVSDILDDVGLGCLGWWSEDWDGVPHLWSLTSVGSASRYATVNSSWRPLMDSSRISRPLGMLRNVMPGQAQTTTRTQTFTLELSNSDITGIRDNTGNARAARTATVQLPVPPAGSSYILDSVAIVSAELRTLQDLTTNPDTFRSVDVLSYFTGGSATLNNGQVSASVSNTFSGYNSPVTFIINRPRPGSTNTWGARWADINSQGEVTFTAGGFTNFTVKVIDGLTVTLRATYRVTAVSEAEDSTSVQRYGRRKLPAQTEHVPMVGQLALGRATLPILAGPPVLADLTIPLWSTNLTPAPHTLRIGDRIRVSLQGQAFEAAVLSLRWQQEGGRMPTVRVLALQCTSTVTAVTSPPNPPQGITVTAGDAQLVVAWSAPATGTTPDSYELQWKLETAGSYTSQSVSGVTYTLTGLTNGSAYDIRVRSVHTAGNSTWVVSSGTPVAAHPAPSAVRDLAVTPGDGQATLTWTAPSAGTPTQYRVRYRPVGSTAAHTTGTHSGSPVTLTGLTNGTTYSIDVRGEDQTNSLFGPWANITVTPTAAPLAPAPGVPTGLTVTASDSFTLLVEWTAPTTGGTVVSYTLRWRRQGTTDWTSQTGYSGASGSISSLTAGAAYEVQVRANGTDQNSDYTSTVTASTAAPAPGAPLAFAGTPGDGQVSLSWAANPVGGVPTDADLQYRQGSSGAWTDVTIGFVFTHTVTGLTNGSSYQFRVRLSNAGGASSWAQVSVTPAVPQAPPTPSGVTVISGDASLVVSWQAAARATSYDVRRNTAGTWATVATGVTALTYTLTGLTNGTAYGVAVRAVNSGGTSAWSATITRTPQESFGAPTLSVLGALNNNVQIRIAYSTPNGWRVVPRGDGQYQFQKDDGDGTWDSFFVNAISASNQPTWGELQGAYWVNNVGWVGTVTGQRRFRMRMHIRPRGQGQEANAVYTEWVTADVPRPASQSEDSPQLIPVTLDGYLVTLDTHPVVTLEVL